MRLSIVVVVKFQMYFDQWPVEINNSYYNDTLVNLMCLVHMRLPTAIIPYLNPYACYMILEDP